MCLRRQACPLPNEIPGRVRTIHTLNHHFAPVSREPTSTSDDPGIHRGKLTFKLPFVFQSISLWQAYIDRLTVPAVVPVVGEVICSWRTTAGSKRQPFGCIPICASLA